LLLRHWIGRLGCARNPPGIDGARLGQPLAVARQLPRAARSPKPREPARGLPSASPRDLCRELSLLFVVGGCTAAQLRSGSSRCPGPWGACRGAWSGASARAWSPSKLYGRGSHRLRPSSTCWSGTCRSHQPPQARRSTPLPRLFISWADRNCCHRDRHAPAAAGRRAPGGRVFGALGPGHNAGQASAPRRGIAHGPSRPDCDRKPRARFTPRILRIGRGLLAVVLGYAGADDRREGRDADERGEWLDLYVAEPSILQSVGRNSRLVSAPCDARPRAIWQDSGLVGNRLITSWRLRRCRFSERMSSM